MLVKAIILQLFLLSFAVIWLAFSRVRNRRDTFLKIISIAILLAGLWMGGGWVYPPLYGLVIFALVLAILSLRRLCKPGNSSPRLLTWLSNIPALVFTLFGAFLLWQGVGGRINPKNNYVDLAAPFKKNDGACVISGGTTPLLNFHNFPSDSLQDIGQTYALDIIKVRSNGFRTTAGHTFETQPADPTHYQMFGTQVFAPCASLVVSAENGFIDQQIGGSDKVNTGGNGVILQCGNYHVHLHHMKQGSVLVRLGDMVASGQELGKIGNSGNTREPHLHLHAETVVTEGNPKDPGKPVHMRFDGLAMARGDCF